MQVPLPEEELAKRKAAPEKLAIGGDGGFDVGQVRLKAVQEPRCMALCVRVGDRSHGFDD